MMTDDGHSMITAYVSGQNSGGGGGDEKKEKKKALKKTS